MTQAVLDNRHPGARNTTLLLGLVLALAVIAATFWFRDLRVNTVIHCVVLVAMVGITSWLSRKGLTPEGVSGVLVPIGLALWLVGHIVELVVVMSDPSPHAFAISDLAFTVTMAVLVVVAYRLWQRSATYLDRSAMLRAGLDTLLLALGVSLVFWQLVVRSVADPAQIGWTGMILAIGYVAGGSVLAGSQMIRAMHRNDAGSWELAIAASIAVLGVFIWSVAKFGPDARYVGVMLMSVGTLLLPTALAHPSHHRQVVVTEGVEHDRMGALAFHLVCWGVAFVSLLSRRAGPVLIGMGLASVSLVYLRVFLVRSSERRLVGRLRVLAFTDPLTSIGNRRSLLDRLQSAGDSWLITIDLDGFKQVNDQYGHEAGDEVLRAFVARMEAIMPAGAHLARIGGDEFAVVFDGSAAQAQALAQRVVEEARDPHYARLTASVGLTGHRAGEEPNKTVRDSDIAMQEAKRAGKDRLAVLTPEMVRSRLRALEIGARLAESIGDIRVVYQPMVALSTGNPVVAVEALARWQHPDLGEVPPDEFIPIAEQQGLVASLGLVVFNKVLDQAQVWLDAGQPRQISVNLSWLQLRDSDSVEELARRIRGNSEAAEWIVLEVTETVFSEDEAAVVAIRLLRDLGVVVAVDDFGTGVSNLRRLRTLPVDVLKIDKSLLDGAATDSTAEAVLEMVSRLGQSLGMAVTAEGVEDEPTARLLAEIGVTAAQGFLFARPVPPDEVPVPIPLLKPWLGRRVGAEVG